MRKTILIVEDEAPIRNMLRYALVPLAEFNIEEAECVSQAKIAIANKLPDLILLDWMLPDDSGINFIKTLKQDELTRNIPIIMLTAKAEEQNKVKGFEVGADDYVTKPFSPRELIARIKALLRRGPLTTPDDLIHFGDLVVDTKMQTVTVADKQLQLTPRLYKLLYFFITHQNRVYTREQLLNYIWGGDTDIEIRTIDVQIKRLRHILREFHYDKCLSTVRGIGYKFSLERS